LTSPDNDNPPSESPPRDEKLFRDAVLRARSARSLGQIILAPHATTAWLVLVSAVLGAAIVLFLVYGSYTRRATVTGQLTPSAGVIRVTTPQAGVVLEKKVAEGQLVNKGDVLYVLTSDRQGTDAREIQADIGQQVGERRRSMEAEVARNRITESTELAHLQRRVATLRSEADSIARQMDQQRVRLKLAEDARKRYQGLADQDYIARDQLFQKEAELSEQVSRLQQLERDGLVAQRELAATQREIDGTRMRYDNQNALLARGISSAQQELTEVEARRRVIVTAPETGRATLVAGEVGQSVDPTRPLLNLVPKGAKLEARLYAPSRTIGFIRPGDSVLLRYQSFPWQKFGQHEGVVESVSNTAATSTELAGFQIPDVPVGEPVYAIIVRMKEQNVTAYGKAWPLSAGMRLDADILQETRRLYEWVLEPLYSITGAM